MKNKPEDFLGKQNGVNQGGPVQQENRHGYTDVKCLERLTGRPWDDVSLAFVLSLNPKWIRVINMEEGQQLDARAGRVTVVLDEGKIVSITMEVQIPITDDFHTGHELNLALKGVSKQDVADMREKDFHGRTFKFNLGGSD